MSVPKAKSDTLSDFSQPDRHRAQANERIERMRALAGGLFRKGATELLRDAYRLGVELRAERAQTRHGQWEKRFQDDLAFVKLWTAKRCLRLAAAFQSEAEMAGLALERARRLARAILGGPGQPKPAEKKRPAKGEAAGCEAFYRYIRGGRLASKAGAASFHECQSLRQRHTSVLMEVEKGVRACDQCLKALGPRLIGAADVREEANAEEAHGQEEAGREAV